MNCERGEAIATKFFEEDERRAEIRHFYTKVFEELNQKQDLAQRIKQELHQQKLSDLRKSWSLRSKLDQIELAFNKKKNQLLQEDLAAPSVASEPPVDEAKLVREELIQRILIKQRTLAEERALKHNRKSG